MWSWSCASVGTGWRRQRRRGASGWAGLAAAPMRRSRNRTWWMCMWSVWHLPRDESGSASLTTVIAVVVRGRIVPGPADTL
eukprot:scaffold106_cov109-Isochrysis_galbana.AAC.6